ncbi:hypothetical protein [Actinomadura macrotermitis]|uniref:Uncharacterized protein n=1 Tax=Actinomadura macrotermitis TaxID=2585200 RepID=A0A7K0C8X4_9ACTN|nr:hypothetical protein [Actinomadura macrotermitis]MQY09858.1 hypothetical protein [Actinomadura macrotermitis]
MKPGEQEPVTILAHALALNALHGPGPWPDGGHPLPDEPPRPGEDEIFMPSVVLDGVRTHHFGTAPPASAVEETVGLLEAPTPLPRLHEFLARQSAVDLADALVTELRARDLPRRHLHRTARHLVEHGTARDTVKLGIVLLGECGDEHDRELLLLLGTLEEFTLYAVVALVKTQPDRERAAYELAQRVKDWGRIHAVERLKGTNDPEIKAWLLREGFRNGIMNEYLAHLAATTGDLYTALLEPEVDQALLEGAGAILVALALGGPAEEMSDYADAVPALHRYAELAGTARPTLAMLDHLLTIRRCALRPDSGVAWPAGEPEQLTRRYKELLARPVWRKLVLARLSEPHDTGPYRFTLALSCAGRLGMPVLPQALRYLEEAPFDAYAWQGTVSHADGETISSVIALAMRVLPLDTITGAPARSHGFSPEHAPDHALGAIINGLDQHPGAGLELLRLSLSARVTSTRRRAFQVLTTWPAENRPSRLRAWISAAAAAEPDSRLREEMQVFLTG